MSERSRRVLTDSLPLSQAAKAFAKLSSRRYLACWICQADVIISVCTDCWDCEIYNWGAFFHHQKHWQLFFSLEDELAQGLVVGPVPGCPTADLVSSNPKQDPGARGRIWAHQTDTTLKKKEWFILLISQWHFALWLTSECPECRKLTAKSPSMLQPHLWWVSATWCILNALTQSLFLARSTHEAQACFGSWFESSQIFAGELLSPHLRGWALQLLSNPWHWIPIELGSPSSQSSYSGCCPFQGQGKNKKPKKPINQKTSHRFLLVCKINKYGSQNIFFFALEVYGEERWEKWEHALINNSSGMSGLL